MDIIHAAGMGETYGMLMISVLTSITHDDTDDDTDVDTDDDIDDDTNDDTDDDTDDGGRGNPRPVLGGAVHLPPPGPPKGEGVRTNFRDLDPVWERERDNSFQS